VELLLFFIWFWLLFLLLDFLVRFLMWMVCSFGFIYFYLCMIIFFGFCYCKYLMFLSPLPPTTFPFSSPASSFGPLWVVPYFSPFFHQIQQIDFSFSAHFFFCLCILKLSCYFSQMRLKKIKKR
jgi:hypothetical protein